MKTGEPAFRRVHGDTLFGYLAAHPDDAAVFNAAMTAASEVVMATVLSCCDFTGMRAVVDVGGGQGVMLSRVLQAIPHLTGVLLDLPDVVTGAGRVLTEAGVEARCEIVGGDFFVQVPDGADAYLMSNIIHDWDDEHCEIILTRCREAMPDHASLMILESVLPDGPEPHLAKLADLEMLVLSPNGRQRTRAEFEALLARAGLALDRVIVGPAQVDVVQARPTPY